MYMKSVQFDCGHGIDGPQNIFNVVRIAGNVETDATITPVGFIVDSDRCIWSVDLLIFGMDIE